MSGFLILPNTDVVAGQPTTLANALYRPTASLTGLTNGVNYRAFRLSTLSPIFATAAAPSYSFLGNAIISGSTSIVTLSADVGSGAGRYILVATGKNATGSGAPTVTVGSTSLTRITDVTTQEMCFFGGLIPSESGVVNISSNYNGNANFQRKAIAVWTLTNLSSTTPKQIVYGNGSMNVSQQDLVFQFSFSANDTVTETNAAATQAPNRSASFKVGPDVNNTAYSADWVIAANNAAFSFGHNGPTETTRQKISFA